ncbi:MAG: homocysteine S-methyltransferase family protein [Polyangia bacterium]
MGFRDEELLIFDGSCGVTLQQMDIPAEAWGGRDVSCTERLNLTAPDAVVRLHRGFLEAGATVIETNTFGASRIVLAEHGLAGETTRINREAVRLAREAIGHGTGRYVAGSIGPTSKLPSLGQISVEDLHAAYLEQIEALAEAGADALIIETCQDLLQARTAVVAAFDVLERRSADLPVLLSLTFETSGTMLVGSDIEAAAAAFEPFGLFSLGLNCATGPDRMIPQLEWLSRHWPGRVSAIPNAGLPEVRDGRPFYPLTPQSFADQMRDFAFELGISVLGGCCGTVPEHIRRLVDELDGRSPSPRDPSWRPALSSRYRAVEIEQSPRPLIIGERMNSNGSRRFRKRLLADDFEGCARIGIGQQQRGAHLLDVCTAYAGRDERRDLLRLGELLADRARAPLAIDSTDPDAIAAVLSRQPGRCLINSINLEDGGPTAERVLRIARRHGAALIALTIGPEGMAITAEEKLAVAREISELAIERHDLRPQDLLFDPLTFTLGSGDPGLRRSALETLKAIALIKKRLGGSFTSLGVSNVSYGLPRLARRHLNSVFLAEAIRAGLDVAIVDAGRVLPLAEISERDREVCLDLIRDRRRSDDLSPLEALLEHYSGRESERDSESEQESDAPAEQLLEHKLLAGERDGLDDLLAILLERYAPFEIVSRILVPAMRRVGELFGRGEMLLPFVLQSAEVMKAAVSVLEPLMERRQGDNATRILLATVAGDVHDIGKNLVEIVLGNNGYRILNLGTNIPFEQIASAAREQRADLIGLSGLLVKSAVAMQRGLPRLRDAGLSVPVLLGGAALTESFVAESCAVGYDGPVVYCADAFAGLEAVQRHEAGTLESTTAPSKPGRARRPERSDQPPVRRDVSVPSPPFFGARWEREIPIDDLFERINRSSLFRARWGYSRGSSSAEEHAALLEREAEPLLAELGSRVRKRRLAEPRVAWGWFRCRAEDETLHVERDGEEISFSFPRQSFPPRLCIADYFKNDSEGPDLVGFFVATIGAGISAEARRLFEDDSYRDHLLLHGLGVELTEALADLWHDRMRAEIGIDEGSRRSRARGRWGFGYPACPDLEAQRSVFELLRPDQICVSLTKSLEMVPELSTSAIVSHHPQARYFSV